MGFMLWSKEYPYFGEMYSRYLKSKGFVKTHQAVICVLFWYIYHISIKTLFKRRVRESDVCNFLLKGSTDINRLDGWMGE